MGCSGTPGADHHLVAGDRARDAAHLSRLRRTHREPGVSRAGDAGSIRESRRSIDRIHHVERINGGGSSSDYIIEVLQRDFEVYFNNDAGNRVP